MYSFLGIKKAIQSSDQYQVYIKQLEKFYNKCMDSMLEFFDKLGYDNPYFRIVKIKEDQYI